MSGNNVIPLPRRKKPRTSDIIAEAAANGKPLPLEVLLTAMWKFLDDAAVLETSPDPGDKSVGRVFFDRALRLAADAAPYLHSRLATTTLAGDSENPIAIARADPFARLTDEVATELLEKLQAGELTIDQINEQIS